MAYQTVKKDWTEEYEPSVDDFNRIEANIDHIKNEACTFEGKKTFASGIETDNIDDIGGAGVKIGGVTLKNGIVYGLVWGA
jgi:hypothetical protein